MTISMEGTIPTKEGDMKPTCSVNMAPPMAAYMAAQREHQDLDTRYIVASEQNSLFPVSHCEQSRPNLLRTREG